jgi:hypothetical protein
MDINKVPHRQTYIELSALKREWYLFSIYDNCIKVNN